MSHDIGVMAEMGDSESDLWKILIDASEEDLKYYSDAFLQWASEPIDDEYLLEELNAQWALFPDRGSDPESLPQVRK